MDNPFKLIKPTDKPPEHLKKDVLDSIELMMLVVRMLQLFMVDYSISIPESFDHFFRISKEDTHINNLDNDGNIDVQKK